MTIPPIEDDFLLTFATLLDSDPATTLVPRIRTFIAERRWSAKRPTQFTGYDPVDEYGDETPPSPEDDVTMIPRWGLVVSLSLDHAATSAGSWTEEVLAICNFIQPVAVEIGTEFDVDLRFAFQPRYSESIGFLSTESTPTEVMLEHLWSIISCRRGNPPTW